MRQTINTTQTSYEPNTIGDGWPFKRRQRLRCIVRPDEAQSA